MATFKVHPDTTGCLCARCDLGQVFQRRGGVVRAFCSHPMQGMEVPLDIERCSEFIDKRQTNRHELEKIAWVIRHDRSGAIRGFEPPPKKDR